MTNLLEFADETLNKMWRSTVYANCFYFVALIYYKKALLKSLSWWGIFTIYRTEADPRWNFNVFFFQQLQTCLQVVSHEEQMLKCYDMVKRKTERKQRKGMDILQKHEYVHHWFTIYNSNLVEEQTWASSLLGMVSKAIKSGPASTRTCNLRRWKSFSFSRFTSGP